MTDNGSTVVRVFGTDGNGRRAVLEIPSRATTNLLLPGKKATSKERGKRKTNYTTPSGVANLLSSDIVPRSLRARDTFEILEIVRDLDPQVSQAVWNFLRLMNPGHELQAFRFTSGAKEEQERGEAQDFLDELVRRVGSEYGGGLDQLHNVLNLTLITKGAIALEVTPTADLSDVWDWYPVDPALLAFRRTDAGELILGQKEPVGGKFIELNPDLVFYQPLDPDTDDPYGRPPILSVVNTVVTLAATIADLRAVSHNQGYPRIDVSVDWNVLLEAAPQDVKGPGNEAALMQWAADELNAIVTEYENLAVDDTFVHYGFVDLKMVGGTAPASLGFNFKEFVEILERREGQSLKHLPILSGSNQSTSETHGSIEWQIQIASIEALQRVTKRLLERAGTASLRIRGFDAHAKVTYKPIRTVDRLYEAQSALFEAKAHQIMVTMGWEDNDEAAQSMVGHDAVGEPILEQPKFDQNTNNSGDKTPGAAENGPGAGGDEIQPPKEVEAKQKAAYDLLRDELNRPARFVGAGDAVNVRTDDAGNLVFEVEADPVPLLQTNRAVDPSNELVSKYADAAGLIFADAKTVLLEQMAKEGYDLRDAPKDIADYVFGLRYSRQMKALLREAIAEGMRRAGVTDPEVPERVVRRIWNDNRQYVLKIRDELKQVLRDEGFQTLADVREWFADNAWREDLMGRYLAKQGLTAGFSYGRTLLRAGTTMFRWLLGFNDNHCNSCVERADKVFSHDELLSRGFPGSGSLVCGANCHCSLEEVP